MPALPPNFHNKIDINVDRSNIIKAMAQEYPTSPSPSNKILEQALNGTLPGVHPDKAAKLIREGTLK